MIVAAVFLPGAIARPVTPPPPKCYFDFPPPTSVSSTTYSLLCSVPVEKVSITRKLRITNASKWAIVHGTSFSTGSCTGVRTPTVTCALGSPGLVPGATFLLGLDPAAKVGERILLHFNNVPNMKPFAVPLIVPAGPKLSISTVVTPDTTAQAPAGTAWDFKVTIGGGKFYKYDIHMPPGITVQNSLSEPTNGLVCGQQGGDLFSCFEQGVKPLPPGAFTFGIETTQPIPQGTVSKCDVFGTGVQQGTCTLNWYQGG